MLTTVPSSEAVNRRRASSPSSRALTITINTTTRQLFPNPTPPPHANTPTHPLAIIDPQPSKTSRKKQDGQLVAHGDPSGTDLKDLHRCTRKTEGKKQLERELVRRPAIPFSPGNANLPEATNGRLAAGPPPRGGH